MKTFAVYLEGKGYIMIDTQTADVLLFIGSPPIFWMNTPDNSAEAVKIVFTHIGTDEQLIEKLETVGISVQIIRDCSNN